MSKDAFDSAVAKTLSWEGGLVNDPRDPGGQTKYGISKRSYPQLDIPSLSQDVAVQIYRRDFWDKISLGKIGNAALAIAAFDFGVTAGPGRAVHCLQEACNCLGASLSEDGIMGEKTLQAINGCGHQGALLAAFKAFAALHYIGLCNRSFIAGWLARLDA